MRSSALSFDPPSAKRLRSGLAAQKAKRSERLAGKRTQELAAQQAKDEQRAEEQHRVDAGPPFLRPVHVLQIQPKREFVQCQRSSDTVQQSHRSLRQARLGVHVGAELEQPTVAHNQQERDAQDQVVDMPASDFDVVEWADPGPNRVSKHPHGRERKVERHRGEEAALPVGSRKILAVKRKDPVSVPDGGSKGEHDERRHHEKREGKTAGMQYERDHRVSRIARRQRRWNPMRARCGFGRGLGCGFGSNRRNEPTQKLDRTPRLCKAGG